MVAALRVRSVVVLTISIVLLIPVTGGSVDDGVPGPQIPAAEASGQPNFIVIVTDDQRFDAIGRCFPAIDATDMAAGADACMPELQEHLAASGTTFLKGEVTQSVCCPSRASILTGQYSTTTGVTSNNGELFDDSSSVATWLDDAGYRTGLIGKYLNGYGFGSLVEYIPPGWDAFHGYHDFSQMKDEPYVDYPWIDWDEGDAAPVLSQIEDTNSTSGEACADGNYYSTDFICNHALAFLEANQSDPFFLYIAPSAPHTPINPAARHDGAFAGVVVAEYPDLNEVPTPNPPAYLPTRPYSTGSIATMASNVRKAMEMTLAVDDMIGALHDQLAADGRLDDTVWFFISDNGLAAGEHRWREKSCEYYICHRVPFVVACPSTVCPGAQPGVDPDHYALNIDIAPTIAELAGVSPSLEVDGRSLVPLLGGETTSWRSEWFMFGDNPNYEGVVAVAADGATYKYVEHINTGELELFDLDADPYELANLAGDPGYTSVQAELLAKLEAHRNGDPPANTPPVADFTWTCDDLTCDFTDTSIDSDGDIVGWSWDFGDGATSAAQSPTHTYVTAGIHDVSLTVTDDDGDTDTASHAVTPTEPGTGSSLHVADLDATAISEGRTWLAIVTIAVVDDGGAPVSGADVSGSWRRGAVSTCGTDAAGVCVVEFSARGSFDTFTVADIAHATLAYDQDSNTDPDGDSDGTSITVYRP